VRLALVINVFRIGALSDCTPLIAEYNTQQTREQYVRVILMDGDLMRLVPKVYGAFQLLLASTALATNLIISEVNCRLIIHNGSLSDF
jgi:hypothetical protein